MDFRGNIISLKSIFVCPVVLAYWIFNLQSGGNDER